MSIAYFSPLNPQKSGISDYSEELLPALAGKSQIDLFVDGFKPSNKTITNNFRIFDYRKTPSCLDRLKEYDAVVCHMGNSHRYHNGIFEVALRYPSIIVFHDFALQHFFLERARELGNPSVYLDELEACHGLELRLEAEEFLMRGVAPPSYENPAAFPMNLRLANTAEGIIVHSEWTRSRLARIVPGVPVVRISHGAPESCNELNAEVVNQKSIVKTPGTISIASFGFITASKGLENAVRALAALKDDFDFHYYLVGEKDGYFDFETLAELYGMRDRISITGYVDLKTFNQLITQTDIAINLRDQTVGETSGSLCRLMAAAVPTVVSDIGWFSELPDDCVVKVEIGANADLMICAYLRELIVNSELRRSIGANARRFVQAHHQIQDTADKYLKFITDVIESRAQASFLNGVTKELAVLSGSEPDELLLQSVTREVDELISS
jgi:glycosyltransferase involved in cell wall biosynthesis